LISLEDCVAMPLQQALDILALQGITPSVVYTTGRKPQGQLAGRTAHVMAVRPGCLVAGWFLDAGPKETDEHKG
jgi:hypothetical protein